MAVKGLILSGGSGSRLAPITHTSAKQLVPVAGKPVLFYALEAMRAAGIDEVGIVVGDTHEEIRAAVGDGSAFGVSATYIRQDAPRGLAHAVLVAEDFLGDSHFCMYLGDNLLREGIVDFVRRFEERSPDALILLQQVRDPSSYGIAELDGDRVVRLVEKPKEPKSDLALVGVYLFGPSIIQAAKEIEPSGRGELEITDAIQRLVDLGRTVEAHRVAGWWKDTGQLEDMLEANRLVLDGLQHAVAGQLTECRIEGRVAVEEGAVLERCHLRGPVWIGAGARLVDCYVGPYTAISAGAVLDHAEVEHAIILERATITGPGIRLEDSLVGRDAVVARSDRKPIAVRAFVGDRSRVEVPG